MFARLAFNIVRKDWFEFREPIVVFTGGLLATVLLLDRSQDFAKGMQTGFALVIAFCFAWFCFSTERQRGTLDLLLSLPVRPAELVLAKFVSLYSMVLFATNIPLLAARDFDSMLLMNAFVLFFSTLCMTCTVVSEKTWAAFTPMWLALIVFIPVEGSLNENMQLLAMPAFAATPFLALISACWFARLHA